MAAANSKGREIAGRFGKQLANKIWAGSLLISRSASQLGSYYDKEVDEQVRPEVVPDHVTGIRSSTYWGPDPITGVFGPADPNFGGAYATGHRDQPASGNGVPSALDQTVRFRHLDLEDLEKPLPHN